MQIRQTTRKHRVWDGSDWDDGYIAQGRFRVYCPDCPRAYPDQGYAMRAHVVWWLEYGECHPGGTVLHHRNEDKLDDVLDNLEMMSHEDHTSLHRSKPGIELTCARCKRSFRVPAWRIRSRAKRGGTVRFCSNECRCSGPRGDMLP